MLTRNIERRNINSEYWKKRKLPRNIKRKKMFLLPPTSSGEPGCFCWKGIALEDVRLVEELLILSLGVCFC